MMFLTNQHLAAILDFHKAYSWIRYPSTMINMQEIHWLNGKSTVCRSCAWMVRKHIHKYYH